MKNREFSLLSQVRWAIKVTGFICFFVLCACASTAPQSPKHDRRIEIGAFGGFAGSYKTYIVTPDGGLYVQRKFKGEITQLSSMDRAVSVQMMTLLEKESHDSPSVHHPGNMTYFVRYFDSSRDSTEWVWGDGTLPPDKIASIHKLLTTICQEQEHPRR